MVRLTGMQRELMEIVWDAGEITLHDLAVTALGTAITPNRIDGIRVCLMQMVTKGAVSEDASVSPKLYRPAVNRDEVGFESAFAAGQGPGGAILTAFSMGAGAQPVEHSLPAEAREGGRGASFEARKEAARLAMEQICRERDEYEAEKARKRAAEKAAPQTDLPAEE